MKLETLPEILFYSEAQLGRLVTLLTAVNHGAEWTIDQPATSFGVTDTIHRLNNVPIFKRCTVDTLPDESETFDLRD